MKTIPVYRYQRNSGWIYTLDDEPFKKGMAEQAGIFTPAEDANAQYWKTLEGETVLRINGAHELLTVETIISGEAEEIGYGVYKSV